MLAGGAAEPDEQRIGAPLGIFERAFRLVEGGGAPGGFGVVGAGAVGVRFGGAPVCDGVFVAPEGQREHFAGLREALEALDRDEAVDFVEQRAQFGGDAEVVVSPFGVRLDFENHRDHGAANFPCGADASFRNVRSSRTMKRSRRANS